MGEGGVGGGVWEQKTNRGFDLPHPTPYSPLPGFIYSCPIIISEDDRQQRLRDWWCVLLLAAIVTALFADVLFLGNNFYVRDLFVYHFPMKHVVREIISRGEFPWWNPYIASGQPMAANPAYEIFYPPQWLIFLGPFTFGFALHVLVHVYLAAIGAFLFFRSMPLRRDAAVFGALSFALSGFLLGTATNLPTFFVWSWAGFAGWAALRVMRGGSIALPSIIFAMPILVGEPVSLLQMFGLMFVVAGTKSARRLATTVAIALLIAAVQLVPAADHARDSIRSRGLIYKTVADFSLPPARAIEFIAPFAIRPVNSPGKQRTHYFLTLYCGVAVLILFVAGIATRQRRWLMVTVIALLSYLLALGDATPLLRVLYACGIRFIRYPEKFMAMGIVTMIGFATVAAHRLLEGDAKLRRAVIIGGIAATAVALISPFAAIMPAIMAAAWTVVLWRVGTNRAWHLIVIALLVADLGYVANRVIPRHSWRFFTPPDAANAFPRPRDGYAVFHRGEWARPDLGATYDAFSAALNTHNALRPYSPAAWGIRTALEEDFDETDLLPTHDLLDSMQRLGSSGFPRWSEPFMQLSNVRYVIDYDPRGRIESPIVIRRRPSQGKYWFARTLEPASEFERAIRGPIANGVAFTDTAFTPAPAAITNVAESSHSADIDVEATGRSFLVATITRHKYWRATIDGQPAPLLAANIAYQGVVVPAGRHHIALRYWNPIVAAGAAISALSLLAVLWYALAAGFRRDSAGAFVEIAAAALGDSLQGRAHQIDAS